MPTHLPTLLTPALLPPQLKGRLAAEARACFAELSESLGREAAKGVPAEATTHPLTASTLAYLKRILGCDTALPVLFGSDGASPAGSLAEEARLLERSSAAVGALLDALLAGGCLAVLLCHSSAQPLASLKPVCT